MHRYLVALGSNQRHPRHGAPSAILWAALDEVGRRNCTIDAISPTIRSRPIGPSQRVYCNGAAVISTDLEPRALLDELQTVEALFGRRRQGQRWRSRTLDLDIVLWSGGCWGDGHLTIPHPEFRSRDFVLGPTAHIAGGWRDPITGLTLRQLNHRLAKGLTRPPPPPR
ncbi:2-amino-4-hydroxy-6-hydroxymethyldihydropteridine diphosphokinase [Novosphingobium jiangmenense]|uniref:2-amino-4-hydroxy-6- hydroxymethyldihydropteridine diphosphokinase n=1 Tax=Novosphingobium jiangmenense TaxID=2791981 RepID=UPI001FEBEC77|nr:2-amino-4-hydroxy-6-hydroxymethyldihydropteridine diphosphokinase [Novosphingobium jiangmenense]